MQRSAELGRSLLSALARLEGRTSNLTLASRGLGLLAGLEVRLADGSAATEAVLKALKALLQRGFIFLPEGEHSNVLGFTPPLTISESQLQAAVHALGEELQRCEVP